MNEDFQTLINNYIKEQEKQKAMNLLLILKDFIEDIGYKILIEEHTYDDEKLVKIEQDSYIDYIPEKTVYDLKTTKLKSYTSEYIRGE